MTTPRATPRIEAISEGIIEAGWLLALGLVPLFFNIYSSRSYEPDKVALQRLPVMRRQVPVGAFRGRAGRRPPSRWC
jgi:hypothetical protein